MRVFLEICFSDLKFAEKVNESHIMAPIVDSLPSDISRV